MQHKNLPTIAYTQEGYDKLKAEFDELTTRRPRVLVELQRAREMGDLSENGAYKAARFELSDLDRRLRRVTYLLRVAKVTESKKTGVVDFGSTVTIKNDVTELTFMVVGEHEADPKQKKLSTKSPFGKAVMGKAVGDTVVVEAPAGQQKFQIKNVS